MGKEQFLEGERNTSWFTIGKFFGLGGYIIAGRLYSAQLVDGHDDGSLCSLQPCMIDL